MDAFFVIVNSGVATAFFEPPTNISIGKVKLLTGSGYATKNCVRKAKERY